MYGGSMEKANYVIKCVSSDCNYNGVFAYAECSVYKDLSNQRIILYLYYILFPLSHRERMIIYTHHHLLDEGTTLGKCLQRSLQ